MLVLRRFGGPSLFLLALSACGDDAPATPGDGSSGTTAAVDPSATSTGADPGTTTVTPGDSTDEGTSDTGFEPPTPMCGNGYVEDGEECDDGNRDDADGCTAACEVPCGLQWSVLTLGPTQDSEIEGHSIARDDADGIVIAGRLREITVKMDGTEIEGDDTVVVQSYDPAGAMQWEQILSSPDGDVLPGGVAVDAAGDVYVAATVDALDGGTAIRVVALAGADGSVQWTHDYDGPLMGEDEIAFGMVVGPDGMPVVSGQSRVADGDDDIWLRKLSPVDGTEVWTTTHTSPLLGTYSTDDGGPTAVAADGAIYVLARMYEDFETQRATLLRFSADGGPVEWEHAPADVPGANQIYDPEAVTIDGDGSPLIAISRDNALSVDFWVYKLDDTGTEQWMRSRDDFIVPDVGDDWILEGLATHGNEIVVLGRYVNDTRMPGVAWWEQWVSRLDADGSMRCQVLQQAQFDGLVSPSLLGYATTTASDGSALVAGEQVSSEEMGIWLGSFRP